MNKFNNSKQRDYLIQQAALSAMQLQLTEQSQQLHGGSLLENGVKLGLLTQEQASYYQSHQLGLCYVSLVDLVPDHAALELFNLELLQKWQAAPISLQNECLTLGLVKPETLWIRDQIDHYCSKLQTHSPNLNRLCWQAVLINQAELGDFLARSYQYQRGVSELIAEALELSPQQSHINPLDDYRHPIVRLVESLIVEAVKQGASDLHFEPEFAYVQLRIRLDGLLQVQQYLPNEIWPAVLARIKILSDLDLTEQRRPQDGRFEMLLMGKKIDFRVSSLPSAFGENLVLRILDRHKSVLDISALKFDAVREAALRRWLAQPAGVILVVGPTGSGKTTSLYAMLAALNRPEVNIMTLEDPIEYQLQGLRQIQVNAEFGVSFQTGLRAILRQDPDVILVGEIRDRETATLAFQAAMTGHLVLSTLHCDRASQAKYRLMDLGVSEVILDECLLGVMAQRLVRRLDGPSGGYAGRQAVVELASRWQGDAELGDFFVHGQALVAHGVTDEAELQRVIGSVHAEI